MCRLSHTPVATFAAFQGDAIPLSALAAACQDSTAPVLARGTAVCGSLDCDCGCDGGSFVKRKMLLIPVLFWVVEGSLWMVRLTGKIQKAVDISG